MSKFSEKLKELRIETKLTQKEIAQKLGVSTTGYAGWEQGYREPSISDLENLSNFFQITVDYLLGLED